MKRSSRLVRQAGSPKLAVVLIGALVALILLSFIVPQRSVLTTDEYRLWAESYPLAARTSDSLGLDAVYSSWFFIAVLALLAVNLTACTYARIVRGRRYPPGAPGQVPEDAELLQADSGTLSQESVRMALARGWRVDQPDDFTWVLWRGKAGRIGSIVLHAGLLVLMLGGIVSATTRFSGAMVLTEGQSLVDAPESYVEVRESPRYGRAFTGAQIGMESISFTYEQDQVTDAVARLRYVTAASAAGLRDVRVNYPLYLDGKSYLLEKAGHSVAVVISDPQGRERVASFISLGETGTDGSSDVVNVGDAAFRLALISDRRFAGGTDPRKYELNDPVLYVSFDSTGGPDPVQVSPGGSVELDGWKVEFTEARLWNRFMVRADGGRWVSFIAFAMVIAGMAIRWLDPDAAVTVRRTNEAWALWRRSRHGMAVADHQLAKVRSVLTDASAPGDESR